MGFTLEEGWQPQTPALGPPLPKSMKIYWWWVKAPAEGEVPPVVPPLPPSPPVGQYRLSVSAIGKGAVTPQTGDYSAGTVVTLTARPNPGIAFDHWAGNVSGTDTMVNITMDGNKTALAYFKALPSAEEPPSYEPPAEEPPPYEPPPYEPPPPVIPPVDQRQQLYRDYVNWLRQYGFTDYMGRTNVPLGNRMMYDGLQNYVNVAPPDWNPLSFLHWLRTGESLPVKLCTNEEIAILERDAGVTAPYPRTINICNLDYYYVGPGTS